MEHEPVIGASERGNRGIDYKLQSVKSETVWEDCKTEKNKLLRGGVNSLGSPKRYGETVKQRKASCSEAKITVWEDRNLKERL